MKLANPPPRVARNVEGNGIKNRRKSIGKISIRSARGLSKTSVTPAMKIGRESI